MFQFEKNETRWRFLMFFKSWAYLKSNKIIDHNLQSDIPTDIDKRLRLRNAKYYTKNVHEYTRKLTYFLRFLQTFLRSRKRYKWSPRHLLSWQQELLGVKNRTSWVSIKKKSQFSEQSSVAQVLKIILGIKVTRFGKLCNFLFWNRDITSEAATLLTNWFLANKRSHCSWARSKFPCNR